MTVKEIELHPGHWKNTGSGANGLINEVTEARKVTKRVHEILKTANVPTTYFEDNSSTNQRDNINYLVGQHNKDQDGLIVSIHFNASGGTSNKGIGTEVLYYSEKDLAVKVAKAISDVSGLKNRGAKQRTDLGVLAKTYEPAILIEVCFVNDSVDVALYRRDFERICQAIAKELAGYLGKLIGEVKGTFTTKEELTVGQYEELKKEIKTLNEQLKSQSLNDTGKFSCKELIKKAVADGTFKETHLAKLDNYSNGELISYALTYANNKLG